MHLSSRVILHVFFNLCCVFNLEYLLKPDNEIKQILLYGLLKIPISIYASIKKNFYCEGTPLPLFRLYFAPATPLLCYTLLAPMSQQRDSSVFSPPLRAPAFSATLFTNSHAITLYTAFFIYVYSSAPPGLPTKKHSTNSQLSILLQRGSAFCCVVTCAASPFSVNLCSVKSMATDCKIFRTISWVAVNIL